MKELSHYAKNQVTKSILEKRASKTKLSKIYQAKKHICHLA